MRLHHAFAGFFALAISMASVGCAASSDDGSDDPSADSELGEEADALSRPSVFRRSDQVHYGRAPQNTYTVDDIDDDLANAPAVADRAVAWAKAHESDPDVLYVGCIHAWLYEDDAAYRTRIHAMLTSIRARTNHPLLMYFEEENASHAPRPVSKTHGEELHAVAEMTSLACATYANGRDTRATVAEKVAHYRQWYHDVLGLPMRSLLIDVDLSDTPSDAFYYGARGDLGRFDDVVQWSLGAAFRQGFAGFHTFGNAGGTQGIKQAPDATYHALDAGWTALEAAHPGVKFIGI